MKDCICLRLWNDDRYIDVLYNQLDSIYTFGNLNDNTDIILYTSETYKNKIINSHLINDRINIQLFNDNPSYRTLLLDQFDLPVLKEYNKVLYLDINVLVNDDLNQLLNSIEDDKIFTNGPADGNTVVPMAFIMYKNSEVITKFFDDMRKSMTKLPQTAIDCVVVSNIANKNKLLNVSLNSLVTIKPLRPATNILLAHYPEDPNRFVVKQSEQIEFLMFAKEFKIKKELEDSLKIFNISVNDTWKEYKVGNDLRLLTATNKADYNQSIIMQFKQLCNLSLNYNIKNILSVGLDAGIVPIIFSEANKKAKTTVITFSDSEYAKKYPLIIGCPNIQVSNLSFLADKYDMVYIDIEKGEDLTTILELIDNTLRNKTIICITNYHIEEIKNVWDIYVKTNNLQPLKGHTYRSPLQCMSIKK
jgi:hypothetical protein